MGLTNLPPPPEMADPPGPPPSEKNLVHMYALKVMTNSQLMDYMVSLHFIDFLSWGILDIGPLYFITLCSRRAHRSCFLVLWPAGHRHDLVI
jgi:hypothetical protein